MRWYRHFIALGICVLVFVPLGTLNGFIRTLESTSNLNAGASLAVTGLLNFVIFCLLGLVVLTPLTAIADYLFTHKWSWPFYVELPAMVPMLVLYLFPWSLFFGRLFLPVLVTGTISFTLPLLLYWAIFRYTDRELLG